MYVVTILLQTTKFYLNLKAVDFIRALSNKIFGITRKILPFFIIVVIFLLCFTNIFYVSELFYGTTSSWFGYLMQTYYIFFAAWSQPTPRTPNMDWVISLWILFTVVFTIVIFNVLIALVTEAYEDLVSDNVRIDNQTKLAMIIETVLFRRVWDGIKRCACGCRRRVPRPDKSKNFYLVYKSRKKEESEAEWRREVLDRLEALGGQLGKVNAKSATIVESEREICEKMSEMENFVGRQGGRGSILVAGGLLGDHFGEFGKGTPDIRSLENLNVAGVDSTRKVESGFGSKIQGTRETFSPNRMPDLDKEVRT